MRLFFNLFFLIINLFLNSNLIAMQESLDGKPNQLHYFCLSLPAVDFINDIYHLDEPKSLSCQKDLFLQNLNSIDDWGETPIFSALRSPSSSYGLVSFLFENGAKINLTNIFGHTPLFHCIMNKNFNFDVLVFLLERGAELNLDAIFDKDELGTRYVQLANWLTSIKDEAKNDVLFYAKLFDCRSLIWFIIYLMKLKEFSSLELDKKEVSFWDNPCSNCAMF